MLQRQENSKHAAGKLFVIKITDECNDMLVRTKAMSTLPGIVCSLRYVKGKSNLFLCYTFSLPGLQKCGREII